MHKGEEVNRWNGPKSRARENGPRGGRPRGAKDQIIDGDAYITFLKQLGAEGNDKHGDLKTAAAKICAAGRPGFVRSRCHRTTLMRHVKALEAGQPVRVTQVLLSQMERAAEREGPAALSAFHRATRTEIDQERMRKHFKWLNSFRPYWAGSLVYRGVKSELFDRYNRQGQVIWRFRNWMRDEGIRESLQEIAIWRIFAPLIEHFESGGIELTWRDFVDCNAHGTKEDDSALIAFLEAGVAWQTLYLRRRRNDLHRIRRSTRESLNPSPVKP